MKTLITGVVALVVAVETQANLLIDTHTDNNVNTINYSMADTGWQSKAMWAAGTGGGLENTGGDNWGVAQLVSVGANTGSGLKFSFDWTPGATAAGPTLEVNYQLIGIVVTNGSVAGTDDVFAGMNFNGNVVDGAPASGAGIVVVDLLDGEEAWLNAGNGNSYPSHPEFVSTAGTTTSFDNTFSVAVAGYSDLSDYDYVGVRFFIDSDNDATMIGSTLTNLSLEAVPEPATLGLVAAFGGTVLFIRRRIMM